MRSYFAFIAEEVMRERLAEARRESFARQVRRPAGRSARRRLIDAARGIRSLFGSTDATTPVDARLNVGHQH